MPSWEPTGAVVEVRPGDLETNEQLLACEDEEDGVAELEDVDEEDEAADEEAAATAAAAERPPPLPLPLPPPIVES